ncbi:hypothetical protein [Amedibacillus sp. YH-ame10]
MKKISLLIVSVFMLIGCSKSPSSCTYGETCSKKNYSITADNVNANYDGVTIDFEISNNSDDDMKISYNDFSLIDDSNAEYSAISLSNDNSLGFIIISGNAKKKTTVFFNANTYDKIIEIRYKDFDDETVKIKFDGNKLLKEALEKQDENNHAVDDRIEKEELLKDLNSSFNEEGIKYTFDTLPKYDSEVINTVRQLNRNQVSKYILDGAQKAYDNGITITSELITVLREEENLLLEKQREKDQVVQQNKLFTKEDIVSSINYNSVYFEHGRYYTVDDIPNYSIEVNKRAKELRSMYGKFSKYTLDKLQAIYDNGGDISSVSIESILEEERSKDNSKEVKAKMVKEGIDIETGLKK